MSTKAKCDVTVLCDDRLASPLVAEHGFSVLVELVGGRPILFDTGSTDAFIKNAEILGKDLTKVEKIVISHGHYDHAGGLRYLSNSNGKFRVYLRQEALLEKYSDERFAGIDWKGLEKIFEISVVRDKVTEISDGIFTFGPVEMKNDFEEPDSYFYVQKDGRRIRDFFEDELNLVIDEVDGIVLITGCAHRGIVNTVEDVKKTFGKSVKTLIGGFHLYKAPLPKIEKVTNVLKSLGIGKVVPYHCTGETAIKIIER